MFSNALPSFTVPTYSIHVDRGVHAIIPGMAVVAIDDTRPPQTKTWLAHQAKGRCAPLNFFLFQNTPANATL
jgi:hypothetical protein